MGVQKTVISEGSGPSPAKGDTVTMEYTGWLRDESKPEQKGNQFDSTTGRGPFRTAIGVGRVIKGTSVHVQHMSDVGGHVHVLERRKNKNENEKDQGEEEPK